MSRIVIITNGNYFARLILEPFLAKYRREVKAIVIVEGDYSGRKGIRALWHIGKRTALPYTIFKVLQLLIIKTAGFIYPRAWFDVSKMAHALAIELKYCCKINSEEVIDYVKEINPELIVSVSCPQKIKKPLLDLATLASINIHSSLLPMYAGLAPYYWVLANDEAITGITAHYMTEHFDEGNILSQRSVKICPKNSALNLFIKLSEVGGEVLIEATEKAMLRNPGAKQDLNMRSYFSHPTLKSYLKLKRSGHKIFRLKEFVEIIKRELIYVHKTY